MWLKRIGLFLAVNILVVVSISLVLSLLGVGPYITQKGLDYGTLAIFCLIWGFGGAFISLGLSRIMAKWMYGVQVIDPNRATAEERNLLNSVHRLAMAAGLTTMPEVGIYDSPEVNAFATGPTRSRSLVAVSSGLLRTMNTQEVDGVLAHEVAHIANGDMVTMTLLQGIINAFVMFFARIIAFFVSQALASRNEDGESGAPSPLLMMGITIVCEIVLGLFGAIAVAAFSRYREYRADAGGARLAGKSNMVAALRRLQNVVEMPHAEPDGRMAAFKISSRSGFLSLFSTHPPLEERIARLQQNP